MQPFEYQRVEDPNAAIRAVSRSQNARFIAGGTNLVDLMKQDVEKPARLIDVNHLQLAEIVELPDGGLRLGALARNSERRIIRWCGRIIPCWRRQFFRALRRS